MSRRPTASAPSAPAPAVPPGNSAAPAPRIRLPRRDVTEMPTTGGASKPLHPQPAPEREGGKPEGGRNGGTGERQEVLPRWQPVEGRSESPLFKVEMRRSDRGWDRQKDDRKGEEERSTPQQSLGHGKSSPFEVGRKRVADKAARDRILPVPQEPFALGVPLEEFLDEILRVGARLTRRASGPEIDDDVASHVHVSSSSARKPASLSRARCTLTLTAASEMPSATAISR